MERNSISRALVGFEGFLLLFGLLLVSVYLMVRIYSGASSRAALQQFWRMHNAVTTGDAAHETGNGEPDFRLWSEKRVAAYKASLNASSPPPIAVLKIPGIQLEVPVFEGTDDLTLDRGAGHIEGTPLPGKDGNVGIAGHRDGFFRGLKDIREGDAMDLVTEAGSDRYVVDELLIVSPDDTWVLQSRSKDSLTLVTCFPFYFVGSAPQRFIVHASIANPDRRGDDHQRSSSVEKGGSQEQK